MRLVVEIGDRRDRVDRFSSKNRVLVSNGIKKVLIENSGFKELYDFDEYFS